MSPDGTCPTCGNDVEKTAGKADEIAAEVAADQIEDDERAPWHFKLLVVMTVVYLVWRFFQIFT
jgi:hypothetical protein